MFLVALLIGIYSYLIFFLGINGWLYKEIVITVTILFWGGVILWFGKRLLRRLRLLSMTKTWKKNKLVLLFVSLFVVQAGVNLIGTLGPELGFDALWYHLMLPKLYLENHSVYFIPGGLLYYSAMPKLAEMLYVGGLSLGDEITVKLIHFSFGLLTSFAIYKLARKFFTPLISLVTVVIFSSNLVVAWESITAYIDLVRAFFEIMALWAIVNWTETKKRKWLVWSAVMLGFAITTKVLAVGSLVVFSVLIFLKVLSSRATKGSREIPGKRNISWYEISRLRLEMTKYIGTYWLIALAIPLPWFVFAYITTGNPVYPFFTQMYQVAPEPLSIFGFFREVWNIFMYSSDPISPIYVMLLPLSVWLFAKGKMKMMSLVGLYCLLAIIVWYFTPRTGGGRFMLPYLPAFSFLCAAVIYEVTQNKKRYGLFLGRFLLIIIICISVLSIVYRFTANKKYIPVIIGTETKENFLTNNLNFAYGDFYDTDDYFKQNIKPTDSVLLYGFHNLYYVDFPFIDASWKNSDDTFNYVATQKSQLPEEFNNWILVYENEQTMVKLYRQPERVYTYK
jgi:hypothetical protein